MRQLISLSPPDPYSPDESTEVFLRGSTQAPMPPESIPPPEREYTIAVWVLSALLVILSAVLVFVVAHIIYNHRGLRTLTLFPRRRKKAIQERIERRYETIEGWIISKRVQEHNDFCQTCVRDFSTFNEEEWVQKNATMDTAHDSQAEDSGSEDGSDQARVILQTTSPPSTTSDDPLELESAHTGEKECTCHAFEYLQQIMFTVRKLILPTFHFLLQVRFALKSLPLVRSSRTVQTLLALMFFITNASKNG